MLKFLIYAVILALFFSYLKLAIISRKHSMLKFFLKSNLAYNINLK